jgi:sugar/nucleoside kinase (ribokinase family)
MKPDVVIIGPLNVDLIITTQAPIEPSQILSWSGPTNVQVCVAGAAGYIAQNLVGMDLEIGVVSAVGEDAFGNEILRVLREAGIDTDHIPVEPKAETCLAIYMLLFGGKKRPLIHRLPTHSPWPSTFSLTELKYILGARHIHCAGYLHYPQMWTDQIAQLFREARARGISTSLDPQFPLLPNDISWKAPLASVLAQTDLVMLDEQEAFHITGTDDCVSAARNLHDSGAGSVVIKQGAKGSFVHAKERFVQIPALAVPVEEVNEEVGAGDAYDAGYLFGFLLGWSPEKSAALATSLAASTLRGNGGLIASDDLKQSMEKIKSMKPS